MSNMLNLLLSLTKREADGKHDKSVVTTEGILRGYLAYNFSDLKI